MLSSTIASLKRTEEKAGSYVLSVIELQNARNRSVMNRRLMTIAAVAVILLAIAVALVMGMRHAVEAAKAAKIDKRQAVEAADARQVCIQNLTALAAAREEWIAGNQKHSGQLIGGNEVNEIIRYLKDGRMPRCPADGAYWIEEKGKPICSRDDLGHTLERR